MPPAARSTLRPAAPAPTKVKKPRATIAPVKRVRKTHPKVARIFNQNFEDGNYPWDDFQDRIIVKSVEDEDDGDQKPLAGVEHYLQQLGQHEEEYKHICAHPNEFQEPLLDLSEQDIKEEPDSDSISEHGGGIDNAAFTRPPRSQVDYDESVYHARLINPAVCLAVVRIAQKNLPFMNWLSAVNHLLNLPTNAPLPKLLNGVFAEDIAHDAKDTEAKLRLVFLPAFYEDGRHALGIYEVTNETHPRLATCLFTPCTTEDLLKYSLVDAYRGRNASVVEGMKHVGGRDGSWVHSDVVEEYEFWKYCVRVAGHYWQNRLRLYMGGEEDGGRTGT